MPVVNPGEVWMVDFGLAAKIRPALLLTGNPAVEELDLVTVLLHTTSLRGNRWELSVPKAFLKPGACSTCNKFNPSPPSDWSGPRRPLRLLDYDVHQLVRHHNHLHHLLASKVRLHLLIRVR